MPLLDKKLKCIKYLISLGCQIENDFQLWYNSFMVSSYSYCQKPQIAVFLPNLALELLDFLLESKVLEVDKMQDNDFNDIRIMFMQLREAKEISNGLIVFFKLLIKHNIFFTQEHLDTLRSTIKLKEEFVEQGKVKYPKEPKFFTSKEYKHPNYWNCYAYFDSIKYLENVKPLLAFVEANVK
jgi:hypothetical protein